MTFRLPRWWERLALRLTGRWPDSYIDDVIDEFDALTILREGLGWYADEHNWTPQALCAAQTDRGRVARDALARSAAAIARDLAARAVGEREAAT